MALLDFTAAPTGVQTFGGRLSATLARTAAALAAWNDARVTRKALNELSDRELEDIGLCRGDIDDIAQRLVR